MKQHTKIMLVMATILITGVGVVQAAGRGIDNPMPLYNATPAGNGVSEYGGAIFTGRPNDSSILVRARSNEGQAEFAVMEMQEGVAPHDVPVYMGRPMDNPGTLIR